jgi:hypothetical protein
MFCCTVERCGCKSGPVELAVELASAASRRSAGCSAQSWCLRVIATGHPARRWFYWLRLPLPASAIKLLQFEAFEQGAIELPAFPLQSASDKTTTAVVCTLQES